MGVVEILEKNFPSLTKNFANNHPLLEKFLKNSLTYDDKIFLTEKLGAGKFQKIVFRAEDLKFKILKKLCPNYLKYHDKYIDWQKNKKLQKLHSDYEKNKVIEEANLQKEIAHKEFYREMNRNYHMSSTRPLEIIKYLEWNKAVHKRSLKLNSLVIASSLGLTFLGFSEILLLVPIELFSAFINFECVNIQNHNIYRFKEKEKKLYEIQTRQLKNNSEKYEEANTLIATKQEELKNIPSIDEIIASIKDKNQLEQLKKLLEKQKATNNMLAKQKGRI